MEVEKLQNEVNERAGSPEGFHQVIRLVLDGLANPQRGKVLLPPHVLSSTRPASLVVFREYVDLMQKVIPLRIRIRNSQLNHEKASAELKEVQKPLSDAIHAVRQKARELPLDAFNRLRAIETVYYARLGGWETLYHPICWKNESDKVEQFVIWGYQDEHSRTTEC